MSGVHDWHIDEREYARHESRRGRRHAFTAVDPGRTALVVVDVVPFFLVDNPYARAVVPNVNRLASALRAAGGTVAWVLPSAAAPTPARIEFLGEQVAEAYRLSGGEGEPRDRLCPDLAVEPDDLVVEKSSASAFFPGHSPLEGLLSARGVDSVIVTGVVTNVCVEATVRDASTLGLRPILVADACATVTDAVHNATLHTVYRSFGDVRSTAEVLGLLADGTARDVERGEPHPV